MVHEDLGPPGNVKQGQGGVWMVSGRMRIGQVAAADQVPVCMYCIYIVVRERAVQAGERAHTTLRTLWAFGNCSSLRMAALGVKRTDVGFLVQPRQKRSWSSCSSCKFWLIRVLAPLLAWHYYHCGSSLLNNPNPHVRATTLPLPGLALGCRLLCV